MAKCGECNGKDGKHLPSCSEGTMPCTAPGDQGYFHSPVVRPGIEYGDEVMSAVRHGINDDELCGLYPWVRKDLL